jgi:hypothetical protein
MRTYTVRDRAGELSLPIQYTFGVHMQTFVFPYRGRFYERMAGYYPKLSRWAITLGDERLRPRNLLEAMGRETSNQEIAVRFDCHRTGGVNQGRVTLDSLKPGVGFEHCHTGAIAHMEDIARGKTATPPAKLGQMGAEFLRPVPSHAGVGRQGAGVQRSQCPLHRLPRSACQPGSGPSRLRSRLPGVSCVEAAEALPGLAKQLRQLSYAEGDSVGWPCCHYR